MVFVGKLRRDCQNLDNDNVLQNSIQNFPRMKFFGSSLGIYIDANLGDRKEHSPNCF